MPINSFENYPMSWKPTIDKMKKPIYQALASQLEEERRYFKWSVIAWNKAASTAGTG